MCRINPRVDFAFKKLFGSEEKKDLLISLINAIVSKEEQVVEIELRNPYNLAAYQAGKMPVLDIKAKGENGRWFNVEMQISEDYHFDKRAIYYWAKLVTEQLSEGMMFKELKKTISINILDFNFIPDNQELHNLYKIINVATGKDDKLHDIFELHYIELKKFTKSYQQISSALDRWVTFLTKVDKLGKNHVPKELVEDWAIVKAIEAVDRMFEEDERLIYEVRMQALAEVGSKIASAEERGMERGIAQGMDKAARAIALNLLKAGTAIDIITQATGLSKSEIEQFML
ncbi:MAG: Rpn family recombination-promoting nuclease/putative transposase [Methylobacter sp.]|uniref:Rpn family recombination-promoting nuclease/putative transposase n=1 Tax=Methylobacter sp. TaxID=2051955 RepID=UPI00273088F4|nr:Rpn family recombination-promoting nuclease/putative transposase [Methylobacter sp.]MDP1663592.1 Rpn family recombination-promoting nuclease/putative transposase [Methylobacter sp.]